MPPSMGSRNVVVDLTKESDDDEDLHEQVQSELSKWKARKEPMPPNPLSSQIPSRQSAHYIPPNLLKSNAVDPTAMSAYARKRMQSQETSKSTEQQLHKPSFTPILPTVPVPKPRPLIPKTPSSTQTSAEASNRKIWKQHTYPPAAGPTTQMRRMPLSNSVMTIFPPSYIPNLQAQPRPWMSGFSRLENSSSYLQRIRNQSAAPSVGAINPFVSAPKRNRDGSLKTPHVVQTPQSTPGNPLETSQQVAVAENPVINTAATPAVMNRSVTKVDRQQMLRQTLPEFKDFPYEILEHRTEKRQPRTGIAKSKETASTRRLVTDVWALDRSKQVGIAPDEEILLKHLKEDLGMSWFDIWSYFPQSSSWHRLQTHYSKNLKVRTEPDPIIPAQISRIETDRLSSLTSDSTSVDSDDMIVEQPRRSNRIVKSGLNQPGRLNLRNLFGAALNEDLDVVQDQTTTAPQGSLSGADASEVLDDVPMRQSLRAPASHITSGAKVGEGIPNFSPALALTRHERRWCEEAAISGLVHKLYRSPQVLDAQSARMCGLSNKASWARKRASVEFTKPYLNKEEREFLRISIQEGMWDPNVVPRWEDSILHVDFTTVEDDALIRSLSSVHREFWKATRAQDGRNRFRGLEPSDIQDLAKHAVHDEQFLNRNKASFQARFEDAISYCDNDVAKIYRLQIRPRRSAPRSLEVLRRRRELGVDRRSCVDAIRERFAYDFGRHLSYQGLSGDVNALAWAPSGEHFAVGAAALTDESSMQYNRPNNLLFGNLSTKTLRELPHHHTERSAKSGINATHSMHVTQDPLLFSTISAVAFAKHGDALVTAGYDKYARVWDLRKNELEVKWAMPHNGAVDLIAANPLLGIFATGAQCSPASIRIFACGLDEEVDDGFDPNLLKLRKYTPQRSLQPENNGLQRLLYPSSLRWGPQTYGQHKYLAAGFTSNDKEYGAGEISLWDTSHQSTTPLVSINNKAVFDIQWSGNAFGRLFIGSSAGSNVNRGIKSVVRVYDSFRQHSTGPLQVKKQCTYELECPALDINDIVLNPTDEHLVSAGCTDGVTYIWDIRNPDSILHRLRHGQSLTPLDGSEAVEKVDTGVRFVSWDKFDRKLYTGSSDGIIACWNPYKAAEDAFDRKIIQFDSGIMSGSFSPDQTDLLIGEVSGRISVISLGRDDEDEFEPFEFVEANDLKQDFRQKFAGNYNGEAATANDTGARAADELVHSGAIELRPLGNFPIRQAVQGPNYHGPFDTAPDANDLRERALRFQRSHRPTSDQCQLQHSLHLRTEEDVIDNGDWKRHIPYDAHLQDNKTGSKLNLSCFRCPQQKLTKLEDGVVTCDYCSRSWKAGVLGFELVRDASRHLRTTEPQLENRTTVRSSFTYGSQTLNETEMLEDQQGWLLSKWGQ